MIIDFLYDKAHQPQKYSEFDKRPRIPKSSIQFSDKEVKSIKKRFAKLAPKGYLTYTSFRESLGLLGVPHAQFLSERIFQLIDQEGNKVIYFEAFLSYLNTLLNGTDLEKAYMSFKFLDSKNKSKIISRDIEQLSKDIVLFWNYMTGSRIIPNNKQMKLLLQALDYDQTGEILFDSYKSAYEQFTNTIDWFEFFNDQSFENVVSNDYTKAIQLEQTLFQIEDQIYECMIEVKNYSHSGPLFVARSCRQKIGDFDPLEANQNNYEYQELQLEDKLEDMLQLLNQNLSGFLDVEENSMVSLGTKQNYRRTVNKQSIDKRRATIANLTKTKKLSIYFGHENWNLVLNMMIGLRTAIQAVQLYQQVTLQQFRDKHIYDVINQRSAKFDHSKAFKFIDYAPQIFERIRLIFNISQRNYLKSVGPEQLLGDLMLGKLSSLSELSSSGKSGSFFYFTNDSKYMIKTISKFEYQLLRKILKQYYDHVRSNQDTLISRIYGLHQLRIYNTKSSKQKIYIIVIANLFETTLSIDVRYDLKGSTYGREGRTENHDKNIALKDTDFLKDKCKINLPQCKDKFNLEQKQAMLEQITKDARFLAEQNIIDYSLLIGIHERRHTSPLEGLTSPDRRFTYFIGIIDVLTEYNAIKQFEHQFKSTFVNKGISCVPPLEYVNRFLDFMNQNIFV